MGPIRHYNTIQTELLELYYEWLIRAMPDSSMLHIAVCTGTFSSDFTNEKEWEVAWVH